jgi:RNA polymerase sigma-70 factor (ECF subfamily)
MVVNIRGAGASKRDEDPRLAATDPPDTELVQRAREGDRAAFRVLVERHQRASYALAMGMLRHEADARDALQEAFLKAFRNLGNFHGEAAFSTWLYRIVTNACIDRRRRRKVTVEADDATIGSVDSSPTLAVAPRNPHRELERARLGERIQAALSKLPDYHRDAVVLREIEGLSYAEIAEATGVSIGTVMSRLFHARQKLQAALADPAEGDLGARAGRSAGSTGTGKESA